MPDPGRHPRGFRPGLLRLFPAVVASLLGVASADTFGLFTYTDNGTTITITDYPTTETGAVTIPSEIVGKPVTHIGTEAFADCNALTGMSIPGSVTNIGDRAFLNCSALTTAAIPATVTTLGVQAFAYCSSLTTMTVPNGVTIVGNSLFEGCLGLTSVTLPTGLTSIGSNAFNTCVGLTSLSIPSTVTSIGSSAFLFCSGLTSLTVPTGVTVIQSSTFRGCSALTSVSLPPGLLTISGSAFADCVKLTGVAIPSTVTSIGTFAFTKCSLLASIAIPAGVTTLSNNLFESCPALSSVTIPSTVTSIGNNVFRFCSSLPTLTIPASVTTIGTDVFGSCSALTAITVDPLNSNFSSPGGVLFNKAQTSLITYPRGLLGSYAVPSTVTTIGANAFRFSIALTSISIPSTVTTIGTEAFAGCSSLTSISVDSGNAGFSSLGGLLFNKLQTTLIACPAGLSGTYAIPNSVTAVTASAFRYCAVLTAVSLPAGVTSIGSTAFAACGALTSATFAGNAPASMGSNVFQSAASTFKVFYYTGATGFTSPWLGYTTVELGAITNWLQSHGLPVDSDLNTDTNGDGVNLLMAYALNLNPNQNLGGSLPQPVFASDQMTLTFYAGASGVTYVVETCTNFTDWTTNGVSLSAPDTNQFRTATVAKNGSSRYMRLKVLD